MDLGREFHLLRFQYQPPILEQAVDNRALTTAFTQQLYGQVSHVTLACLSIDLDQVMCCDHYACFGIVPRLDRVGTTPKQTM